MIIDSIIQEYKTPKEVAIMLNNMNVPSPRGGNWHYETIRRLAIDETHLGKIISNKSKGDAHIKKKSSAKSYEVISKDKWVVVNNCHEAIKTEEEHEKILLFLARRTKAPKRTQKDVLPLSSLVKCGKCGHTMGMYKRNDRKSNYTLKPCWYTDFYGKKCDNSGMVMDVIHDRVNNAIDRYYEQLLDQLKDLDINDNRLVIEQKINLINNDLTVKEKSLDRVLDAFESGLYNTEQFKTRKEKIETSIMNLRNEIDLLEIELKHYNVDSFREHVEKVKLIKDNIRNDKLTDKQKNDSYKLIIDKIIWLRDDKDISIDIKFYQQ